MPCHLLDTLPSFKTTPTLSPFNRGQAAFKIPEGKGATYMTIKRRTSAANKVLQPQGIPSTGFHVSNYAAAEINTEGNVVSVFIMTFKT